MFNYRDSDQDPVYMMKSWIVGRAESAPDHGRLIDIDGGGRPSARAARRGRSRQASPQVPKRIQGDPERRVGGGPRLDRG